MSRHLITPCLLALAVSASSLSLASWEPPVFGVVLERGEPVVLPPVKRDTRLLKPKGATTPDIHPSPREQMKVLAWRAGVPAPLALGLWQRECSQRATCPDGDGGLARGPLQVKAEATADVGKDWGRTRDFIYGATTGLRYLALSKRICGSWRRALGRYGTGKCGGRKPNAYVLEVEHLARVEMM